MYQRTVGDAGPYNSSIFNLIFCISLKLTTLLPRGSCHRKVTEGEYVNIKFYQKLK